MDRAKAAFYWNTLTRLPEIIRFRRNPYAPLAELQEIQLRLLKRRLLHAWELNPLYRQRMEAVNLEKGYIQQMTALGDLRRFPIITKGDLSGPFDQVISRGYRIDSLIKSNTAGSTGRPLIFYVDHNERFKRRYVGVRNNLNITGCQSDDVHVLLSHYEPLEKDEDFHVYKTKLINRLLFDIPHRVVQISPYRDMHFRRELLEKLQPDGIQASIWDLYSLAQSIKKSGGASKIKPRLAIFGMGWMPDYMLGEIQEILKTEIRGVYGSREFGDFAAQCQYKRYHCSIDAVVIEAVDEQGEPVPPGTVGRLLITDLYNFATPFIRYENGDMGTALSTEECECGLTLPVLPRLEGRIADFIINRDGDRVVPSFFWNEWRQEVGLEEAQLIQSDVGHLKLNLVVNQRFNEDISLPRLRSIYTQKMGDIEIDFAFVSELEREPSGKLRMVKSDLAKSYLPHDR